MSSLEAVLGRDPRITYALVFGSTARGTTTPHSDLDVAIGLAPGPRLTGLEIGAIIADLETASGREVDLVLLDEAPPALAYRVFRDGKEIFVRDRAALVERKTRAILEYLDWKPIEEIFIRGVLARADHGR